ncbi:hypothetical protein ACIPV2_00205 [Microbacterium sp. NPDC089987]|uniref:hypothetical protein n=1 Tax=Microbacterium sp. NPDC089987 TaxID=3364202 RepID=UPI003821F22A
MFTLAIEQSSPARQSPADSPSEALTDRNSMITKTSSLVVLALVSAIALTGCTADAAPPKPRSDASAPAQPSPPPTPDDPLEGKVSGDPIDAELASTINQSWSGLADDKAYQMPSGEWVYLKGNEPLPTNVHDAVTGILLEAGRPQLVTSRYDESATIRFNEAQKAQAQALGRHIIIVIHAMNSDPNGGPDHPLWSTGTAQTGGYSGTSEAEARAVVQSWVDKSPGTRAMVVLDGLAG